MLIIRQVYFEVIAGITVRARLEEQSHIKPDFRYLSLSFIRLN